MPGGAATTGVVLNLGQVHSTCVAFVANAPRAIESRGVGAATLTQLMMRLMAERHDWISNYDLTFCRDLKEHCYVKAAGECG